MKNSLILLLVTLFFSCKQEPKSIKVAGDIFGTFFEVTYLSENNENYQKQFDSIFSIINTSMSNYQENSDISKLNRNEEVTVDANFIKVFNASKKLYRETEGVFDPTIGKLVNAWNFGSENQKIKLDSVKIDSLKRFVGLNKVGLIGNTIKKDDGAFLDFNAIAKGYAVDVLAKCLRHLKVASFLVEIGGEIVAQGKSLKSNSFWKVAIDDPHQGENRTFIQVITLENKALATSGNYRKFSINETTGERWVHSINPKTGKAIPSNILSVSVLAENCMKADAFATALMVMPLQQAKLLIEKQPSLEAYWILSDSLGKVKEVFSSGFLNEN